MAGEAPNPLLAGDLFDLFRFVCPSFVPADESQLAEWHDEPIPPYIRVGGLARHLIDLASSGRLEAVKPGLDLVERAIEEGDADTRELVITGLLEDMQNLALQTDGAVHLVDLRALLGPKSMTAWDELMRFWHGEAEEAREKLPPGSLPD